MHLEKLLREALPTIDQELIANAVGEILANKTADTSASAERIAELETELADHRREIARLQTVIVNQRSGWENASPAALGVLAERARQKRMEGYDDNHDDEHSEFELSAAAFAYLGDAIERARGGEGQVTPPSIWPWEIDAWRRKPIHRQLEVVGALLIAEQERLGRNGLADML
ncbi:hypothetical protein O9X98_04825 [Agrobacterium salinitolerans]|nr:hypothetical protein [Agrobacterium salinitolerans]